MIYVIRNRYSNDTVDVTSRAPDVTIWSADRYVIETHPDATPAELAVVAELDAWLRDHYNDGAHWVYETTAAAEHVMALRDQTLDAYKSALRAHWELIDGVATDIRNA